MDSLTQLQAQLCSGDYDAMYSALMTASAFLVRRSPAELRQYASPEIFMSCISRVRPADVQLLVRVLSKVLAPKVSPELTAKILSGVGVAIPLRKGPAVSLETLLTETFSHPATEIRCLVVDQIVKRFGLGKVPIELFRRKRTLLDVLIRGLADKDLAVVKLAHTGLVATAKTHSEIAEKELFRDEVIARFRAVLLGDLRGRRVLTMRLLELFVELSTVSEAMFSGCVQSGLLDVLVDLMDAPDVLEDRLGLLNVLELFKGLVGAGGGFMKKSPSQDDIMHVGDDDDVDDAGTSGKRRSPEVADIRAEYFERKHLFGRVVRLYTERFASDPMMSVFLVSLIGDLKDRQRSFDISPGLFRKLAGSLTASKQEDKKLVQVSLEVLGVILSRSRDRLLEASKDSALLAALRHLMTCKDVTLASTFLYFLATILQSDTHSTDMIQGFFGYFKGFLMHELFGMLKSPFEELRIAVLNLFCSLATHNFGAKILMNYPGFYEFIIDRATEDSKPCLQVKFHVIEALSVTMKKRYGEYDQKKIIEFLAYVRNGPFFKADEANVKVKWGTS